MPVIGSDPRDVLRSDRRDFCDSPFHLSTAAARERTEKLATELERYVRDFELVAPPPNESVNVSSDAVVTPSLDVVPH